MEQYHLDTYSQSVNLHFSGVFSTCHFDSGIIKLYSTTDNINYYGSIRCFSVIGGNVSEIFSV